MGTLESVSNDPPAAVAVVSPDGAAANQVHAPEATQIPAAVATAPPANKVTIISAAIILALFTWLFQYMVTAGVSHEHWDRLIALYNSVQAIVAAAVGALLGAQVSAGQATVARAAAAEARQRAVRLETNIKGFQTDLARAGSASESAGRDRLLTRAMALLH